MPSLKSIIASTLLLGLPLASTAPTPGLDIELPNLTEPGSLGDFLDDVGDVIEDAISAAVSKIVHNPEAKNIIPHRYIVVYNNTFDDDAVDASVARISSVIKKRNLNKRSLSGKLLSTSVHSFNMNKWRAMLLDADDDMIQEIYHSDEVEYVEADTRVAASTLVAQTNAPVGLNRLSHRAAGADTYVFDNSAGEGITAYVLDTGVLTTHSEFGDRASWGANFINEIVRDPMTSLRGIL